MEMYSATGAAWRQGVDSGIDAIIATAYPPMQIAPDYQLTRASCYAMLFGTTPSPLGYQEVRVPDIATMQRADGWTISQGSLSGQPLHDRIYSVAITRTVSAVGVADRTDNLSVHAAVLNGRAYIFVNCVSAATPVVTATTAPRDTFVPNTFAPNTFAPTPAIPTFVPNTFTPSASAALPAECAYATGCPLGVAGNGTYMGAATITATIAATATSVWLYLQPESVILYDTSGRSLGRGAGFIGVLSLNNPDIDPSLRRLPVSQWAGRSVHVFVTNGLSLQGTNTFGATYTVSMIWEGSACVLSTFRSAFPMACP